MIRSIDAAQQTDRVRDPLISADQLWLIAWRPAEWSQPVARRRVDRLQIVSWRTQNPLAGPGLSLPLYRHSGGEMCL